jgi:hypothetical protein
MAVLSCSSFERKRGCVVGMDVTFFGISEELHVEAI